MHIYDGNTKVSVVQDSEYVSGGEIIGDDDVDLLDEDDEEYEGDGQICTAAGCVDGGDDDNDNDDGTVEGQCTDRDGVDNYGDGCSWYSDNSGNCGSYDNSVFSASVECCACGGGDYP